MPTLHELFTEQFYDWEVGGRGWRLFDRPVAPEPPFRPFHGYVIPQALPVDDARRSTFLSSIVQSLSRGVKRIPEAEIPEPEDETEPEELERHELVELHCTLPPDINLPRESFEHFLSTLHLCRGPITFELLGQSTQVIAQFAVDPLDASTVKRQLVAHFPEALFTVQADGLDRAWDEVQGEAGVVEFGLASEFLIPLATGKIDPYVGIIAALSELEAGELGLFQVTFQAIGARWAESVSRLVTTQDDRPLFVNKPELTAHAKNKIARPMYAAVVRIAAKAAEFERVWSILLDIASSLRVFGRPGGNELIPLENSGYPFEAHEDDVLRRQCRRSGMVLGSDELVGLVHLPSSAVRSPKFKRQTAKTKAAPSITAEGELLLGDNVHAGHTTRVCLTAEQRSRHMHVIGASGTGKSTFLFNLIRQDIERGEGVALLDPHGDLVDRILGIIPTERINDVVLVDPADEEYSVGFNILAAHSDLEKNLLASDLISVFQRLSSSWGDQMASVLNNAIRAFLESSRGGTIADLRRFLLEPTFRDSFLETVRDPEIVYYWKKAFTQLSGNKSIGPVLTRLETFLSPKSIRYMVAQPTNRLDFADILDSGKIFLAKLSQGQIGKENAFLLGSLIVAKFQQLIMARQARNIESRKPYYLYIDEFHNFITPSLAEILSGARKYRLAA